MLIGWIAIGGGASAQEAAPVAAADHPLVGTWPLGTDPDDPDNAISLGVFSADGTSVEIQPGSDFEAGSVVGAGVWESTCPSTAYLTFWILDGPEVTVVIRSEVVVAPSALELTGTYTLELLNPDVTGTGQFGPDMVKGTRLVVELPGVPTAPLDDLLEQLAATPDG